MNIYIQKNCKYSLMILENLQGMDIANDANVFVYENDKEYFPKIIKRTPTILYNNYPYEGINAFKMVETLKEDQLEKEKEIEIDKPVEKQGIEEQSQQQPQRELLDASSSELFGFLNDNSSFELTEIPKEVDDSKELDLNKLMEERAASLKELGIN